MRGAQLANMSFLCMKYDQYFVKTSCLLLCKSVYTAAGWVQLTIHTSSRPMRSAGSPSDDNIITNLHNVGEGFIAR